MEGLDTKEEALRIHISEQEDDELDFIILDEIEWEINQ